ncbi:hypothetical protein [Streptomyces sp. NRRL B-24484]|uniref:hypothetical protein n=1 Tax=Streptomyces sp. NRRL B-24484 TaxID=1463833 RepID=UPI0004C2967A|nr:hypothetical protein [Streptomyces sp. NRRL B-24484]
MPPKSSVKHGCDYPERRHSETPSHYLLRMAHPDAGADALRAGELTLAATTLAEIREGNLLSEVSIEKAEADLKAIFGPTDQT